MVKWRDVWTLELDDMFKEVDLGLTQRMKLLAKIMSSQMMAEVEVKQEVINKFKKAQSVELKL